MKFNIREHLHIDYGHAVTSQSGQGATADRVVVHVDSEHAQERLISRRPAYVSVSRGRYDAHIYTNDAGKLGEELSRDVSKQSALETGRQMVDRDDGRASEKAEHHSVNDPHAWGKGYGMEH